MGYNHRTVNAINGRAGDGIGGQIMDANRIAVQGVCSGFQTVDGATVPVTSPITASATATKITMPGGAVRVIVTATTACNVSEDVNFASNQALTAGTTQTWDIARQDAIYIKGSGAVSFAIQVID